MKICQWGTLRASSPARKNVLSPISERKIKEKAAKKPDFPIAECAAQSCKCTKHEPQQGDPIADANLHQPSQALQQHALCVGLHMAHFAGK